MGSETATSSRAVVARPVVGGMAAVPVCENEPTRPLSAAVSVWVKALVVPAGLATPVWARVEVLGAIVQVPPARVPNTDPI